ncbi:CHASE4 domain-containing protein [Candidatus Cryosericum septentrionale]|nr:CHASE4 domain-containing protein [Candidatus Cryosericum septentrionale]
MSLRTRLSIVALIALTVFVAAFYVLTGVTIDRTYARVDNESAQRQVLRAHSYMDYVLGALGSTCSDWAYWDDTYQYVVDQNPAYADSNLTPSSLATIDVDIMVVLDTSGKVVSAKFQTLANQTLDDTVADLVKQLRPGTAPWTQAMVHPGLTGYIEVEKRVVMVAARPILTSASTGPARGVLVFVRYLDDAFFAGMAETVGGPVTFQPVSQVQPDTVESRALALLTQGQSTVGLPTGTDEVRGFEQHTDLAGNPAFLLATTAKRTQSTEITQLKRIVVLATSMIGFLLAALAIFVFNHTILKRVTSLGSQVAEVGHTSDLALRVHLPGSDELSQLATDVNTTLESLQQTQRDKDRMAEELERDRKRLHDYFDHAHDLIFALDTHGKVTLVNRSVCSVLGYDEKDLLGRSILDVVSPDSRESAVRAAAAIESGDTVSTTIIDVLTRDGDRRTLDVSGQRLWDNEQLTGTFYIARDITERLRMEHELLRNQSLESLGMLAAGIAHDFNNVLTVVKGNISLADSSLEEPTESQHYLEVARIAADRAQALAGQLLTFSRGGAPVKENIDVESIIQEVARFTLSGSNVALQVSVDGVLAAVEGDRNQLFQMLQNIILNARDAMPSGGALNIALRSQTVSEEHPIGFAAPGDCVVIQITDTGPGIAPEDMKLLFDPFFTTKPSGHGVGLATARSIARRHGGDLLIESAAGKGTTVQLCMPVARGPVTQPKAAKPEREHGSATGRLLVMDDEQTVADVTCAMARRLGYETTAVPDGEAALTAYAQAVTEQHPFDLVIMDLTVPGGMGGREAVQRLHELYPDARVIVSSGYSDDASIAEYAQRGFIASLSKPYTMEQLERVLRESSSPPLSS